MNQQAQAALAAALARTVQGVPGVAFLKPDVAQRLRSALSVPRLGHASPPGGLRVSRTGASEPWRIEVQIVTRAAARAVDVTRATRTAIETLLEARDPAATSQITITVTGIV
ncbi:hypothetical protein [Streptomyces sp. NPDC058695]|uniref:hypothetical protein n=1 Tax=Streptomyces sp. NPDC058695 TaxID=3346604 RepID=UPI00365178AA